MVTFRKSLLLVAIVATMAAVANAQVGVTPAFQCVANAGVPPIVRAEGLAELVGDVVLNCTGGTPTANGDQVPKVNFRIFLNVNITSWLIDSSNESEAILMIDDPAPANQRLCGSLNGCSITGVGAEPGVDYAGAGSTPNIYRSKFIPGATGNPEGNTLEWLGVPIDPPGTQAVRIIRITNVRGNAAQKGVGGGFIPTQLVMYISATGTTSLPINNPEQVVAFVQDGLTFSTGSGDFLQCEDPLEDSDNPITIKFKEQFATAFKRRNVDTSTGAPTAMSNQNMPGAIYNTETGFYNSSVLGNRGRATQGTRLVAHFKNIPSGVTLKVSQSNIASIGDNYAAWAPADTKGAGGTPESYSSTLTWKTVTLSGGAGAATWEILGDDPVSAGEAWFYVQVNYTPNTTAGIPALGTGQVSGSYGPVSSLVAATTTDLQPRFIDDSTDFDLLTIDPCATNLLWPYVTNQNLFDTGMVISNTSMDPFQTATQEGPCKIYYYGNSNGGPAPAPDTTPKVPAGQYAIWTLSSGGTVKTAGGSIAAAQGFEGYVIAHCEFQYAHGYAFISDLGAQKLAQGYIALILDESIWGCNIEGTVVEGVLSAKCGAKGSRTGSKSEPLDQ